MRNTRLAQLAGSSKYTTRRRKQTIERAAACVIEAIEPRLLLSVQANPTAAQADLVGPTAQSPAAPQVDTSGSYTAGTLLVKMRPVANSLVPTWPALAATTPLAGPSVQVGPVFSISVQDLCSRFGVQDIQAVFASDTVAEANSLQLTAASASSSVGDDMQAKRDELSRWYRLTLPADADVKALAAAFAANPEVEAAEPQYEWKLTDTIPYPITGLPDSTTDPNYDEEWYLNSIHAQQAWDYLKQNGVHPGGSRDVVVAVIDTGVDITHPDLVGNVWTNAGEIPGNGIDDDGDGFIDDVHGASVVGDARSHSGDVTDYYGHGTHVSGIIAAQGYNHIGGVGVAFNVQIMPIRAAQYNGTLNTDDISEGIMYAVNHGAEVINMSFGGYQHSQIVEDALAMALNQAVLVAAAGNDGQDGWTHPMYPAALPYVHGVMATTASGAPTWFTNTGYDLSAPGEGIFSTLPGGQYAAWSGTSMAAPMVSGIAAMMRSFFWQRDIYSSRFLMGALWAAGTDPLTGGSAVINAYTALTTPPTPGVVMLNDWLFDDKRIAAGNDADGRADSGETLNIALEVINRSGQADNVLGTLRAHAEGAVFDDPYVTISTPTVNFGSIGPFATKDNGFIYSAQGVITGATHPFVFTVSPDCPNDHIIPFEFTTTFTNGWDLNDTNVYTRVSRFEFIVQRGKNVPTVIPAGTTVTLGGDDYWIVGGPVLVEAGATLIVAPGAQVQWGAMSSDPYNPGPQTGYMIVRGTLTVQGTGANPASLFPSYLVSGQTTRITVESGGTANLAYVKIRNPYLIGLNIIDHANLTWDAYASCVDAEIITNTAFGKFRGGGTLTARYGLDTCLFDAGWITPASTRIDNTVFLQDNENNHPLSYTPAATYDSAWLNPGGYWAPIFAPAYRNGDTYGIVRLEGRDVMAADYVARYFGGHLVSIHSPEDQAFLESYWWSVLNVDSLGAIGLIYDPYAGEYRWSDGSPLDYQNWATGQPANVPPGTRSIVSFYTPAGYPACRWSARALDYSTGYWALVRMPGTWSQAQWNAEFASGRVTQYVRDNIPGYLHNNAFLNKYWDPNVNNWMRIIAPASATASVAMRDNYWGTTTTSLIDHAIVDYYDNFTSARIDYGTPLAHGATTTWPFVEKLLINGVSADTVPTVGSGPTTFTITFNRDMDPTVQPYVTFGPSAPCTDFSVKPIGDGWIDARTWQGSFYVTPVTGEGYQLMRISGAVAADDPWLVSGYDVARYRFQVKTMGVASMNLQASGQEGSIHLSWQQNDYDLLAGYNIYRSDSLNGTYTKINSVIIPAGHEYYDDTTVSPAVPEFYKFTVITTSMTESGFSNVASAAAIDTVPPVITHTPVTAAPPGAGLRISATLSDNLAVVGGKLHYRARGSSGSYAELSLINTSGTTWAATIPGSSVGAPGVDYYLTATDGISTTYHGTPAAPHTVVVQSIPTVSSVAPSAGGVAGGQTVTVSGTMFQQGATVLFGGQPATNVVVLSGNQLTCTTPSHFPAQVDVQVINPDTSQATLLNGFRFQDTGVVMSLPTACADHGAIIELPITLSNVDGLRAADITITFASSVLTAQSVRVGPLATGWGLSANTGTAGQVRMSLANGTAVSGSGVLAYITFAVPGAPMTQTSLTITTASLNDGAIVCDLSPGTFTVNGVFNLSGNVTYYTGGGAVRGTGMSLVGVGVQSTTSNASGQYSFAGIPTGAYTLTPSKSDDVAEITAYDASLVLQAATGLITLSANQRVAADVNRNGTVNSMDASYILERSVGLLTLPFPGAGRVWDFVPGQRTYSLINGDQTAQDFAAVLLGDVSGNWQAPEIGGISGGPVALSVPLVQAVKGGHVVVPVAITRNSEDIYATDLVLRYDSTQLVLEQAQAGAAAAGMLCSTNTAEPGVVRVGLAGAQPLGADGTLVELHFQVIGTLAAPARISFDTASINEGAVLANPQEGGVQDTIAPSVTINQAAGQADPTLGTSIHFLAMFSESVNGFTASGVVLSGTAGATSVGVAETGPMDGTTYLVTVSGMTQQGTVIATIPAAAATDIAGHASTASTSTDNCVYFNVPPTDIGLSASSIAESRPVGTAVGMLSTTDPDSGDTFTYSLVSGSGSTDNGSFAISGNQLLSAGSFNYEAKSSYSIRVRTTDQGGLWVEKAFTISVLNVAELAPTITGISNDTGVSSSDGITSDKTLLINGTAEPGMSISVYRGGVLAGTTAADGSGNWSFDYTATTLADGSYSFSATASDGLGNTTPASAAYGVRVDTAAPAAPSVTINSGAIQRSMVREMDVAFTEAVNVSGDALALLLHTGGAPGGTSLNVSNPSGDKRNYHLSFAGTAIIGGSLADGVYDLIIRAAGVQDLAGNHLSADSTKTFHRLFGDADGNKTVTAMEALAYKNAVGTRSGTANYVSYFDYDGNGTITAMEYLFFKSRVGVRYVYT